MSDELKRRVNGIACCLEPLLMMMAAAETHALPGPTLDGLLRARLRLTQIQGWLSIQGEK